MTEPIAPEAGPRARGGPAVASVALAALVLVGSELLPVGLLPGLAASLHVSVGTAGLLVVVPGLVAAVTAPLAPILARDWDRRTVLIAVTALIVLADAVTAATERLAVVIAGRVLLGVAVGAFWTLGVGVVHRLVPAAVADRATSTVTAGVSIGSVLSLPLGALIGDAWRPAFAGGAAIALVALVAQLRALPPIPAMASVRVGTLAAFVRNRWARAVVVVTFLLFVGNFSAATYVVPYLRDGAGLPAAAVSAIALAYGVAGVAGNFAAGFTAGRSLGGTLRVAAVALAAALGLAVLAVSAEPVAVAAVILWGAAFGAVPLCLQTWIIRGAGAEVEAGLAVFMSTTQIALALGSLAGGLLVDGRGILTTLGFATVVSAGAALVLTTVRAPSA